MPIYLYRNLSTGETFEIEQRMVDDALTSHPVTGDPVKRLVQPVGIAFKGSGFYVTDSRGKNGANGAAKGASKGATEATSGSADAGASGAPVAKSSSTSVAAAAD